MPTNEELIQLMNRNSEILKLEPRFYDHLLTLKDWEFVILLSTLFEAALVNGIVSELKDGRIKDVISYLELANMKCSKVELASSLSIISKDDAKFIRKIAEIRNLLAHRIDHRDFSLSDYITSECHDHPQKLNSLVKTLTNRLKDQIVLTTDQKLSKHDAILKEPKEILLANSLDIMTNILYLTEAS